MNLAQIGVLQVDWQRWRATHPAGASAALFESLFAEHSEAACADPDYHAKLPNLGSLAVDKPTFDWLIRAADVDVRLLMLAFGV